MNTKLLTLIAVGALTACSQADAPKAQAQQAPQTVVQKTVDMPKADMKVTHVDAVKALEIMKARPELVVVDVRTPGEFAAGHIEGAINIDFKNPNFATKITKLDGAQDYLIHCRSGGRSGRSLAIFKAKGFSHIIHMDGGMLGWNKSNLPTVK